MAEYRGLTYRRRVEPNYASLQMNELKRLECTKQQESAMSLTAYQSYLREKFGSGSWADHLINDLLTTRCLERLSEIG